MSISLVIAVTDRNWLQTLRQQPNLEEVNFWSPSERGFGALQKGEFFLFKPHKSNMIVGGGIFIYANQLPCSLAWEAFGKANGAQTYQEMQARILSYRRESPSNKNNFPIGCRILTQPFFLQESEQIPVPASWASSIQTLKRYTTDNAEGLALWKTAHDRLHGITSNMTAERYGEPHLIRSRLGQGAFRLRITDNYQRTCAVTGERTLPALEAAHIRPYSKGGLHDESNGLLLRSDIHNLFDAGYVTVTPDFHFEVSRRIKEEFENGRDYYSLHGDAIKMPNQPEIRPHPGQLTWHNENCFLG